MISSVLTSLCRPCELPAGLRRDRSCWWNIITSSISWISASFHRTEVWEFIFTGETHCWTQTHEWSVTELLIVCLVTGTTHWPVCLQFRERWRSRKGVFCSTSEHFILKSEPDKIARHWLAFRTLSMLSREQQVRNHLYLSVFLGHSQETLSQYVTAMFMCLSVKNMSVNSDSITLLILITKHLTLFQTCFSSTKMYIYGP